MNLDERIEELVDLTHTNCPYEKPCPVRSQSIRACKELISEVMEYVKPEREDIGMSSSPEVAYAISGHNACIRDMEAKIKELGL